jgi:hypothetical protein
MRSIVIISQNKVQFKDLEERYRKVGDSIYRRDEAGVNNDRYTFDSLYVSGVWGWFRVLEDKWVQNELQDVLEDEQLNFVQRTLPNAYYYSIQFGSAFAISLALMSMPDLGITLIGNDDGSVETLEVVREKIERQLTWPFSPPSQVESPA